ncbi:MAG: hypothetical protein ACI89T_001528 [Cognaticolwellia sp.]|jgi:hypothetical protein
MKFINAALVSSVFAVGCFVNIANAGLLKSTTNTNLTERNCSSVNDDFSAYKAKWGTVIVDNYSAYLPGKPTNNSEITPEAACIFNTQWEKYEDDSTPGTKVSQQNIQTNVESSYIENSDGDIWLKAQLDNSELALPEAHFLVNSQESERNSANLFSGQSFLWAGETTTLDFTANFDFSMSIGNWGAGEDSFYGLTIGTSIGMDFDQGWLFPDMGDIIASDNYQSIEDLLITDETINYRSMTISFDVNNGDEFQLWGLSQAFALNGGWIDSSNSMKTQLAIEGLSVEDSQDVFTQSLKVVPTSVPEPSTLAIFALGMIGLASRRFKKQS